MAIASKVASIWPAGLIDERVQNGAQADAELAQVLAGRARWLYEMATGGPAVSGEPSSVPVNPQGTIGHDHSGPPYGSAMRHRLVGFDGDDLANDDWTTAALNYELSATEAIALEFRGRVWIRPHVVFDGAPYSVGVVVVRAVAPSGDQLLTADVQSNGAPAARETFTATSTATTFELTNRLALVPGWNDVLVALYSSVLNPVFVSSIAVMQSAKR